tara:strand:- start:1892 stop:2245 length:354 start_codon:yes stop_codon:yes gene_type:complete
MATFPSTPEPSYGLTKNSQPNVRVVRFADGFEHRIHLGLSEHQNAKLYDLAWNNITETESDTIEAFLDSRADDRDSFDYTLPGESSSYKFVCDRWRKKIDFPNRATITATFRQVFEP